MLQRIGEKSQVVIDRSLLLIPSLKLRPLDVKGVRATATEAN
jgi:hypothetical protein